ncbi:MAG: glycoside-pentoside-hexuronide (GPH):cation symporter [Oscillospiraceae bacterium]|nr:glycoside-pentoside-hexuronide (GPH):cation symporter [Oscillospiraceae bacterium]
MKNGNIGNLKTYTKTERNMYGLGILGQNILYNIIGVTLAYYLQFTILIPAAVVGTMLTISRIWDAVNDPMMGTIVDKTRTKWGKCKPYLMFAPVPVGIFTMLAFANRIFDTGRGTFEGTNAFIIVWAVVTYLLWEIFYTIGDIPLWGVSALMTESSRDRDKLLAFARTLALIGGAIGLVTTQFLPFLLSDIFKDKFGMEGQVAERWGFIVFAVAFTVIGTAGYQLAGIFVKERIALNDKSNTMLQNFKIMWRNKPFRQILLSGILGSAKNLIMLCAMPLVTYFYANKDATKQIFYFALLGGGVLIGNMVAMSMVPKLLTKFTKKDLYNYSNLIAVVPFAAVFAFYSIAPGMMISPAFLGIFAVLFTIGGMSMGLMTVLQSLMIADAIDYEEYHYGVRTDGVFFAGQTFIAKMTAGIATIMSTIAYSIVGFSDSNVEIVNNFIDNGGIARENPEFAPYFAVLFFLVSIPPAISSILTVIPTWKYALSDKEHTRIIDELNERRHGEDLKVES